MTAALSRVPDAKDLLNALDQRLGQVAAALLGPAAVPAGAAEPGAVAAELLPLLVEQCRDRARPDARWLLLTGLHGGFPTPGQLVAFGRRLELDPPHQVESQLLADVLIEPERGRADLPMEVVAGEVLVDVDFSARHDAHTGIHRVVRETVPRWANRQDAARPVHPVAWLDEQCAFRPLSSRESKRVLQFSTSAVPTPVADDERPDRLIVPWRSVVVLVDVPNNRVDQRLVALARFSGNTLSAIGYDLIPLTNSETRPFGDAVAFAQYLSVMKHVHRVAGISRSATGEFAGFASSVRAQGLPGPEVHTVELVSEAVPTTTTGHGEPPARSGRPVVVCPGSREPHKNHRTVLHAAERLWREGLDFEVRLVGGAGWTESELRPAIDRLTTRGRPLQELGRVSDEELTAQLQAADVAVFISLHEGYGLPVTEALACGTPVVTADFGSQREIAEQGGCLMVDPRDDDEVADGLRLLLTDPEELGRLRAAIAARPVRTWAQYADELWTWLVEGDGDS